jgi:hypothetical protein
VDRRRIELQLRAVLLTYRVEHRRRDSSTMREFRKRAHALLDGLEAAVGPHPDLKAALDSAREELLDDDSPPRPPRDFARSDTADLAEHS